MQKKTAVFALLLITSLPLAAAEDGELNPITACSKRIAAWANYLNTMKKTQLINLPEKLYHTITSPEQMKHHCKTGDAQLVCGAFWCGAGCMATSCCYATPVVNNCLGIGVGCCAAGAGQTILYAENCAQ